MASTLLGVDPPRLPSRQLVKAGELFGISEGTVRVVLSRMVAAGDLVAEDGWYQLTGALLDRQARQAEGRHPRALRGWRGRWTMWVVDAVRRPAAERNELRLAMRALHVGELREGVWLRPDNLDARRLPNQREVVARQCQAFIAQHETDSQALAASLWDLEGWATVAEGLASDMQRIVARLERDDGRALAPGWELSAAVLRHLVADPLLPAELLPEAWPGDRLRHAYDRYDATFKQVWRAASGRGS